MIPMLHSLPRTATEEPSEQTLRFDSRLLYQLRCVRKIMGPAGVTTMRLLLRRTLVRSFRYAAFPTI